MILVKPSISVSTKEVYQGIDGCEIEKHPDNDSLMEGLKNRDYAKIYASMENVLEAYTLKRYSVVKKVKKLIEENTSAQKILMSGSGPTVFAIYKDKESAIDACKKMREMKYECYWTRTTR